VRRLKKARRDLMMIGSTELAKTLVENRLIDELEVDRSGHSRRRQAHLP
jgi:dihydrofolate reductase